MSEQQVIWAPHAGPQSVFLASTAYEVLYGGAAGGGKSDALLFGALRQVSHPKYRALILRRTFRELTELMDRAHEAFGQLGGVWNERDRRWTFPSGATIEFGYCETYADVFQYQGQQYSYIGFDELGQVQEERIWTYLMSRNRARAPGLELEMRASANPGGPGHYWLKRRFVDVCEGDGTPLVVDHNDQGEPITRAFVKAVLTDNPTLVANDPNYATRLRQLPDLEYRWLFLGDWSAGGGLAFPELGLVNRFIAEPFEVPKHWYMWGSFDWGYNHPWRMGLFAQDEDLNVYKVETTGGRHQQPPEIAERWFHMLDTCGINPGRVRKIVAGHDVKADIRARSENIPTVAEQMQALGIYLQDANISRIAGVQNMRRYFAGDPPKFRWFDTPNNRRNLEVIQSRISDPDDIEDVLKTDADDRGFGGDDDYDELRYGLAARPIKTGAAAVQKWTSAWDERVLQAEGDKVRAVTPEPVQRSPLEFHNIYLGDL